MTAIEDDRYYKEVVAFESEHPGSTSFSTNYGGVSTQALSKYAVGVTTSLASLTGEGLEKMIQASSLDGRVLDGHDPESLRGEVTELLARTWLDLGFPVSIMLAV